MAWWDKTGLLGRRVSRASSTIAQTGILALFTVAGGAVLITYILGRVSVVMGAVANNMSLEHSVGNTVLCAVLATANDTLGSLYQMSGDPAEPLQRILAAAGARQGGYRGGIAAGAGVIGQGILANIGNIQQRSSANNTGEVTWTLFYFPLEVGATVVAA